MLAIRKFLQQSLFTLLSSTLRTIVSSQFKGEREVFSTNGVGKTSIRMTKNEGPQLITYTKIN